MGEVEDEDDMFTGSQTTEDEEENCGRNWLRNPEMEMSTCAKVCDAQSSGEAGGGVNEEQQQQQPKRHKKKKKNRRRKRRSFSIQKFISFHFVSLKQKKVKGFANFSFEPKNNVIC